LLSIIRESLTRRSEFDGKNVESLAKVVAKGGARVRICKGGLSGVLWKKADEKE
jgi:hypothetical protein